MDQKIEKTSHTDIPKTEASKPSAATESPGSGIRSMPTTSAFRVVNFELYAKPNKFTMVLGATIFSSCIAYIIYMNVKQKKDNTYTTINLDGSLTSRKKTSKWD